MNPVPQNQSGPPRGVKQIVGAKRVVSAQWLPANRQGRSRALKS